MSVRDVSSALKHVHNNLDVDTQWQRARSGLAEMTDLERAQVWTALSSLTLSLDDKTTPVVFSQYKALYKAAMKSVVGKTEVLQCCCVGREGDNVMYHKETGFDGKEHPGGIEYKDQERGSALYCDRATIEMLDKYEKLLEKYQFSIDSFQGMQREGENQLILSVQQIINQSDLWGEMKKQIKDTLDKGLEDLIEEFNTSEIKTALVSIQADKANESSLTNISDTLTAMHSRIDILTSKLDHSTLGNLSTQVNAGTQQIEAMKISLATLIDGMEGIKGMLRVLQVEHAPLTKNMDDLTKSLAHLVKTTMEQGHETRKYIDDSKNFQSTLAQAIAGCVPDFEKLVEDVKHIREQFDGEDEKATRATLAHVCQPLLEEITRLREEIHRIGSHLNEEEEGQDASPAEEEHDAEPANPRAKATSHLTNSTASTRAKASPPRARTRLNPYAKNQHKGGEGASEIFKEKRMRSEFHTDDDDNDTPDLNWWPSGRASSPSAPGSP
jgi:hypothetical protein